MRQPSFDDGFHDRCRALFAELDGGAVCDLRGRAGQEHDVLVDTDRRNTNAAVPRHLGYNATIYGVRRERAP